MLSIMDYIARNYNPAIGRFIQPDTIVPSPANPENWNRYSYANNNPIKYTDPSGHFPLIGFYLFRKVLSFFGWAPDDKGIATANKYMDRKRDSVFVAAGIAVQSQWHGPWDTRRGAKVIESITGGTSGIGIAQVKNKQMKSYGLEGRNQEEPSVAIQAMTTRIGQVVNACKGCNPTDKLVASALAQNGGFERKNMLAVLQNEGYQMPEGGIDWGEYFDHEFSNPAPDPIAHFREQVTGLQYNSQFMLRLYTNVPYLIVWN